MMIDPPLPASIIAETAARMVFQVPVRFTSMTAVPLLLRHFEETAPAQHTRVGHHDVEPAELLDPVRDHLLQCGQVADIHLRLRRIVGRRPPQPARSRRVPPTFPAGR